MLISNAEVGNSGNIDHIWHSDAVNYGTGGTWNFVSDGTAKRSGNSAIQIGFLNSSGGGNFLESVGIGTTTPNSLLHLHQSSTSGFDGLRLTNSTTGVSATSGFSIELDNNEGAKIWHYGNENISFGVDNELHGTLRSDGSCLLYTSDAADE